MIAVLLTEKKSHTNGKTLPIGCQGKIYGTRVRNGGGTQFLVKFPGVAGPMQCEQEEIEWRRT